MHQIKVDHVFETSFLWEHPLAAQSQWDVIWRILLIVHDNYVSLLTCTTETLASHSGQNVETQIAVGWLK